MNAGGAGKIRSTIQTRRTKSQITVKFTNLTTKLIKIYKKEIRKYFRIFLANVADERNLITFISYVRNKNTKILTNFFQKHGFYTEKLQSLDKSSEKGAGSGLPNFTWPTNILF